MKHVLMWPVLAVFGLTLWAGSAAAQQNAADTMTGFTRNTVTKYKVTSSAPYTLQRDGTFDATNSRTGLNWKIKQMLGDGRVVVATPDGSLVGFDGTQIKTNATDGVKSCSAVTSLGVKSRNLSSQGLNECPK